MLAYKLNLLLTFLVNFFDRSFGQLLEQIRIPSTFMTLKVLIPQDLKGMFLLHILIYPLVLDQDLALGRTTLGL